MTLTLINWNNPIIHTIIHFIETRLQYNWHNNKNADGLVNMLASNLVILNQVHIALKEIRNTCWLNALSLAPVPKLTCFSWASRLMFASLTQFCKIPGNSNMFSNSMVFSNMFSNSNTRELRTNHAPIVLYAMLSLINPSVRSVYYWRLNCGDCEVAGVDI